MKKIPAKAIAALFGALTDAASAALHELAIKLGKPLPWGGRRQNGTSVR